jgi:hypothetical protein
MYTNALLSPNRAYGPGSTVLRVLGQLSLSSSLQSNQSQQGNTTVILSDIQQLQSFV